MSAVTVQCCEAFTAACGLGAVDFLVACFS